MDKKLPASIYFDETKGKWIRSCSNPRCKAQILHATKASVMNGYEYKKLCHFCVIKKYAKTAQEREGEVWAKITEAPMYAASNLGRIKNVATNTLLKPQKFCYKMKQYLGVRLYLGHQQYIQRYISRLVYFSHRQHTPKDLQLEVDHLDNNPFNNNLTNLDLKTHIENRRHSVKLYKQGHKNGVKQGPPYGSHNTLGKHWTCK